MNKLVIEEVQRAIDDGDNVKAQRIIVEQLVTNPRDEQLWLLLSQVVPPEKAKESLERVLKINPNNQEAVEKLKVLIPGFIPAEKDKQREPDLLQSDQLVDNISQEISPKEQDTVPAREQNRRPLPIAISEEEFEELLKQPLSDMEEQKEPINLGLSKEVLDEFNNQTDIIQQTSASSLDVTEEELEALFKRPSKDFEGENEPINLGEFGYSDESNRETDIKKQAPTSSLEVTDAEIEALFKKMEQRNLKQAAASDPNKRGEQGLPGQINQGQKIGIDTPEIELDNLLNIGDYPQQTEEPPFSTKKEFKIGLEDIIPQKNNITIEKEDTNVEPREGVSIHEDNQTNSVHDLGGSIVEEIFTESRTTAATKEDLLKHETNHLSENVGAKTTPVIVTETPRPQKRDKASRRVTTKQKPKSFPKWILALILIPVACIILVAAGVSWYYFYGPCGVESVTKSTQYLFQTKKRWDDSLILATNSSRIVLTEPLVKLEDIRQEVIDTKVPTCMQDAKENLQNSMQATIEGYISFLQYVSEDAIREKFSIAATEMNEYNRKMQEIQSCAPFCILLQNSQ